MNSEALSRVSKGQAFVVNIAHITACCIPIVLHLADSFDAWTNIALSTCLVVLISLVTARIWSQAIELSGVMFEEVPTLKLRGLRLAREKCFARLWVIPSQNPMSVSDTAWTIAVKTHGNTVRGALSAATTPGYLPVGILCLVGYYIGFSGDYGIALDRFARAFNASSAIQLCAISLSGIVCTAFLFNGLLQYFISQSNQGRRAQ